MTLAHVVRYCAEEVERQEATIMHVSHMFSAWEHAAVRRDEYNRVPTFEDMVKIAYLVDPVVNDIGGSGVNFRSSNVTVDHKVIGSKPGDIARQMTLLCDAIGELYEDIDGNSGLIDEMVKQLLEIHPWADGNGRTSSIVYNWLCDTLDFPNPLPYYYGKK